MLLVMGIALALLIATLLAGKSPKLGLDLQGGVSVNLQPVKDGEVTDDVTDEQLDQAIAIIRRRVDAVGVSEPDVSRQGNTITVQIPGATDQQEVLDLVGQTAELRFRPVLAFLGPEPTDDDKAETQTEVDRLRGELGMPDGVTSQDVIQQETDALTAQAEGGAAGDPNAVPQDPAAAPTTAAPPTTSNAPATTIDPTSGNGGGLSRAAATQDPETPTTEPPAEIVPVNEWGIDVNDPRFAELAQAEGTLGASQVTPKSEDQADVEVTLLDLEGNAFRLGPTLITGQAVESATAGLNGNGQWVVQPTFKEGPEGIDLFNSVASICYNGEALCPPVVDPSHGSLGVVLDSDILTTPAIQQPSYTRDGIEITGDFDQESAQAVAVALRYGSLPIELEPQQAETVSATLGEGALTAGIVAGLIGLVAVFGYLFAYYRRLALITLASLATSATLLWVVMSWIGATVTLAGVVGLVVSIGIAIDSSVVSFEGLKEDVRKGSTLRSVSVRSMTRSYSTIVKADTSSLIGAAVLYWLSIGPVRGFAFYLGAATLLDLFSAYFVLRPGVVALSTSKAGADPIKLGIPIDDLPETTQEKVLLVTAKGA